MTVIEILILTLCWFSLGFIGAIKFIQENYGSTFLYRETKEKVLAIMLSICLTLLGPFGYIFYNIFVL